MTELERQKEALDYLVANDVASTVELEANALQLKSQREKVANLGAEVTRLKDRIDKKQQVTGAEALMEPKLVTIQAIQDEIQRLKSDIEKCRIASPVSGKVVRVNRFAGEQAASGDPIVEVVEENSTEIELFLIQSQVDDFQVGKEVSLLVNSGTEVSCQVQRMGMQFQNPPSNLVRFYPSQAKVVPVYLTLSQNSNEQIALFLDSQVRLPRRWRLDSLFPGKRSGGEQQQKVQPASSRQAVMLPNSILSPTSIQLGGNR